MWTMKSHFTNFESVFNFAMTRYSYYNYQLSKAKTKFGDQDFKFNLCCCHVQLAPFPAATYLSSITSCCSERSPHSSPEHMSGLMDLALLKICLPESSRLHKLSFSQ